MLLYKNITEFVKQKYNQKTHKNKIIFRDQTEIKNNFKKWDRVRVKQRNKTERKLLINTEEKTKTKRKTLRQDEQN